MSLTAYLSMFILMGCSHLFSLNAFSQSPSQKSTSIQFVAGKDHDLFGKASSYIQNIGQYGDLIPGHPELGKILYGYEGLDMPVLFTTKGVVHLQRKMNKLTEEELEEMEEGNLGKNEKKKLLYTERIITMEWRNSNSNAVVEVEEPLPAYHTYGMIAKKASAFKKITYKEMYPGIDVIYSFNEGKRGFEYSLVVHPGADVGAVQFQFGGDVKEIKVDTAGDLLISSDILSIQHTLPLSYYCEQCPGSFAEKISQKKIISGYQLQKNLVRFVLADYDRNSTILIDPFVSPTSNLSGLNAGIAKDIDFDYDGNIYISGGGDLSAGQLAKYSSTGNLLWTFNGRLTNPNWSFGGNYGGWVVEKTTGKIYLGQGGSSAFQIIRLNTLGQYDNYITPANPNFLENWKMIWNCEGGTPKIFIAGGGTSDNLNLGVLTPPATSLTSLNITGQPGGHQDISDMVVDPKNNQLYTIFSQNYVPTTTESNRLYKHTAPYNASSKLWTQISGFRVLAERANRPYLSPGLNDNSVNMLAVNSDYLFYYDGKNLKAMNKSTGNDIGSGITFPSTALMQGGIVSDECNNVYIGAISGTIKVYKFTGSTFDDAAAQDISIPGFSTSVYDLVYDDAKGLIYASGNGFVASIDIASWCAATIYKITVQPDCPTLSAKVNISPALPAGSTITYVLYNGVVQVTSNSTGIFTKLDTTASYTVKALIDKECGGAQALTSFNLFGCTTNIPPVIRDKALYVPNAFTPNNDGLNDILKVLTFGIKEFKYFSVYNRWGELVFTTTNPNKGWDGNFKGKKQNMGVYAWITEAIDLDDKLIRLKGTTVLLW
ncbi:MAG TPA: gliding motility-associated C-terminal domain-containing protein [Chitinophagaceae bacterium]|nr:gliding motility-associated C-terminal domain-containing protein [Chitinophagaceae bacterium]